LVPVVGGLASLIGVQKMRRTVRCRLLDAAYRWPQHSVWV